MSLLSTIQQLFPQARVTSGYRGPNNALTKANPHSWHAQGSPDDPRAVDVAPIPGVSFQDYVSRLKASGVPVAQAFDEATHPYPWTTGPNWHIGVGASNHSQPQPDVSKPYYTGADQMPQSLFPVVNGVDPLAPQPPAAPVPMPGQGPSVNVAAASPAASHKRGGILGALESVFMPDPGSRWAGALRDGLFNAKESQQNYLENDAKKMLELKLANQKLLQAQQHGEYQVVGNNVFHVKPDGSTEMISGPSSTDDKTKLVDVWAARHAANPNDPTLPLLESLISGGNYNNTPEGAAATNATRRTTAHERANATIKAATIRGPAGQATVLPAIPQGWKVIH